MWHELALDPFSRPVGDLGRELVRYVCSRESLGPFRKRRCQAGEHGCPVDRDALDARGQQKRIDSVGIVSFHGVGIEASDELGLVGHSLTQYVHSRVHRLQRILDRVEKHSCSLLLGGHISLGRLTGVTVPPQSKNDQELRLLVQLFTQRRSHSPDRICVGRQSLQVQAALLVVPCTHLVVARDFAAGNTLGQRQEMLEVQQPDGIGVENLVDRCCLGG
ncbi:hypothetical protein RhoFasGS6_05100 [Rhodococcus fascians]|nr:hypothetical protein [Rhodococcus fascians]